MVALGRPGAGEELLTNAGFVDVRRIDVMFAMEFADPQTYARSLAATGPAYEAIQAVGEQAFHDAAVRIATERVRAGPAAARRWWSLHRRMIWRSGEQP